MSRHLTARRDQRGVVLVLVLVAMAALLGMVGLALDAARLASNKTRLQAVVDSAALSAAKVLTVTGSTTQATAAAQGVFTTNAATFPALQSAGITPTVEYSAALNPFAPGTVPARFVRVRATNFGFRTSFLRVLGVNSLAAGARAVAGPQSLSPPGSNGGQVCDLAPVMVCGDPAQANLGYTQNMLQILKLGSGGAGSTVGPGNFQLIRLNGNGANVVRQNLAGSFNACATVGATMETQTGNQTGPVAQGLNTRFNQYSGGGIDPTNFPPDVTAQSPTPTLQPNCGTTCSITWQGQTVTTDAQINFGYAAYNQILASGTGWIAGGVPGRREIAVPIGDCSGTVNGQGTVPVLGVGCFFLIQPVVQQGTNAYIYGEFIDRCPGGGTPGPPGAGGGGSLGAYIIQLYRDYGSEDS
jgi:hypothetical protein